MSEKAYQWALDAAYKYLLEDGRSALSAPYLASFFSRALDETRLVKAAKAMREQFDDVHRISGHVKIGCIECSLIAAYDDAITRTTEKEGDDGKK